MDAAAIRLKELKDEMVHTEYSEFQYIDGSLVELKLIPHDIEIITPKLFFHRQLEVWDLVDKFEVSQITERFENASAALFHVKERRNGL